MKIAISNIAWQVFEEEAIANIMQSLDVRGVEVAPTKIWDDPLLATDIEINNYRNFWNRRGIQIVAMQALLFGRPELTIFRDSNTRKKTFQYLAGMIEIGSKLGAHALVFGSPKNRRVGELGGEEAGKVALPFFYELGEIAARLGVIFCIEPNPAAYNCDFITDSIQGLSLVNKVGSEGFGLHLDAAGMTVSEEAITEQKFKRFLDRLCHFHISEPYLAPIGEGKVNHQAFARILTSLHYDKWTSVEMKAQSQDSNTEAVKKALEMAVESYC